MVKKIKQDEIEEAFYKFLGTFDYFKASAMLVKDHYNIMLSISEERKKVLDDILRLHTGYNSIEELEEKVLKERGEMN